MSEIKRKRLETQKAVMIGAVIGSVLGIFQIPPVGFALLIATGIVTGVVVSLTGITTTIGISFILFLVLLAEFLLTVTIIAIVLCIHRI